MHEVLNHFMPNIEKSQILTQLKIQPKKYFLVSAHREENVDSTSKLQDLLDTLQILVKEYDVPIVVSTHPRTRQNLEKLGTKNLSSKIQFLKPFGFLDYIKLQMEALCILSDSGTITEESSLLNLPAINTRDAHERPEGMDEGTLILSNFKAERILDAVRVVTKQHKYNERSHKLIPDYDAGLVSKKILRIVLSYVDYVNRVVWFK
jgi:UDP-N-acetylglucosamine 2-epimerase (non-hydrolysing)